MGPGPLDVYRREREEEGGEGRRGEGGREGGREGRRGGWREGREGGREGKLYNAKSHSLKETTSVIPIDAMVLHGVQNFSLEHSQSDCATQIPPEVQKSCIIFTRPFLLVRGWGLGTRLGALLPLWTSD